ncbi:MULTISPECIES: AzlD domain-containing protein [Corynebacterium]|uniref:branched-chain amino acid transporter permease n=1 Tax=Corynebacterium TaxID=1716 RepID=UPI00079C6803|nr:MULTISPECIES: AzlD domain-containing protein [Corynebacterium]KXI16155.1 putative branched-chain amino acid transport protein AzlD [Corynebacterium sp. CMW7794]MBF9011458.1 AzlD domain-containing protein [Corynebacterium phoceense]MCQ9331349.1 AzlD domain-containing protein [Corynebacterium phoceense]MCQ9334427.1 AzlD domain-containing protein [Corynebacterium phoceense]MCQ9336164.1 AzlD domain-containing protein [Corynebacterium phoceense]
MPEGVTLGAIFAVLLPVCVVTVLIRWLPFGFVKAFKNNQFISLLGLLMPVGVMTVLVVYTVFGQREAPGGLLAALLGVAATVGLHLWRHNSGLSIIGGTLAYMALVNLVF